MVAFAALLLWPNSIIPPAALIRAFPALLLAAKPTLLLPMLVIVALAAVLVPPKPISLKVVLLMMALAAVLASKKTIKPAMTRVGADPELLTIPLPWTCIPPIVKV